MYTEKIKNQENKLENASLDSNYSNNSKVSHSQKYIDHLIITHQKYSTLGKKVFQYICQYKNRKWINLKNATISKEVGCCIKTVTRWTERFERDGFISKSQTNKYATNNYTIAPYIKNNQNAFLIKLNMLPSSEQNKFIKTTRFFLLKTGCPTDIEIRLDNKYILKKPIPIIPSHIKKDGLLSAQQKLRHDKLFKGVCMLNKQQKEWVIRNADNPKAKELIDNPKVKRLIFTPIVEQITSLLSLDKRDQLKLVAIPDEVLNHMYNQATEVLTGANKIKDKTAWFMAMCTKYCKANKITIDWSLYFRLCTIFGIVALEYPEKNEGYKSAIKIKVIPADKDPKLQHIFSKEQTREERIEFLRKEIDSCVRGIQDYNNMPSLNFFEKITLEGLRHDREKYLKELVNLTADLGNNTIH